MNRADDDLILEAVARFYLQSRDFNGIPIGALGRAVQLQPEELNDRLLHLIDAELIGILGEESGNPHINRRGFPEVSLQKERLTSASPYHTCVYPLGKYVQNVVAPDLFADEPFKRELALGCAQLSFRTFDLSVLEFYRNDPRYYYSHDDISGRVSVTDEFFQSNRMSDSDQVVLSTFGFAYDSEVNRCVAVFLRYLSDLTSEHQRVWRAKEVFGDFELHPDYYRPCIIGDWPDGISMCRAFIEELRVINDIAGAVGRERLFRHDFREDQTKVPKEFCLLIRPTSKEFHNFVHVLDKLLSENLNVKFFGDDVSFEIETLRKDGRVQVDRKGTLLALDEWIRLQFKDADLAEWDRSIATMRGIRKLRQQPAHSLNDDKFDQQYIKQQRQLMEEAYTALNTLRLLLEAYPDLDLTKIKISNWLREGRVWTI